MGELDFVEWLQIELNRRDWRQSNLAERGGISNGLLSQIMNGLRKPGPSTLVKIADALRISREEVFSKWGYLSTPTGERAKLISQINFNLNELSLDDLETLDRIADSFLTKSKESESGPESA